MKRVILIFCSTIGLLLVLMAFKLNNLTLTREIKVDKMVDWYSKLLDKSIAFSNQENNKHFRDSLQLYIDTCKIYNFSNHTRLEPYICQPIILNKSHDKAIVLILSRTLDLGNDRVEYITYVSAKYQNNKWFFKVKIGHSDTFHYIKNYPTTSDTEIGINILGRLIQYGYIKRGEIYSEGLFNSDMYVLK